MHDTKINKILSDFFKNMPWINLFKTRDTIRYDLMHAAGIILTVKEKEGDYAWRDEVRILKTSKNDNSCEYERACQKFYTPLVAIQQLDTPVKEFLIHSKVLLKIFGECTRDMPEINTDSIAWGCADCIVSCYRNIVNAERANLYLDKLNKIKKFEKRDFKNIVEPTWRECLIKFFGKDYSQGAYRETSKAIGRDEGYMFAYCVRDIGNLEIHVAKMDWDNAIQGAMMTMIEDFASQDSENSTYYNDCLIKLGILTNRVNNTSSPIKDIKLNTKLDARISQIEKLWAKETAKEFCEKQGWVFSSYLTYASLNKTEKCYWLNSGQKNFSHDWDILLDDWIDRCFYILRIPANTFSFDDFKKKKSKDGKEKANIEILRENQKENFTNLDFGQFCKKVINY